MTLFEPNETITSGRVRLSALTDEALAGMPWLEAALAPEWTLGDFEAARGTSEAVLISDEDGHAIGLALVRLATPVPGDATLVVPCHAAGAALSRSRR